MSHPRDSLDVHIARRRRRLFDSVDDPDRNKNSANYDNLINKRMLANSPTNDSLRESPFNFSRDREPIKNSFLELKNLTFGKDLPVEKKHYEEILSHPQLHFDKIIQRANEYLVEAIYAITRLKNSGSAETELVDCEIQIEKTLKEVSTIAWHLRDSVKETAERRLDSETLVSPRVLDSVRSRDKCVDELFKSIRDTRKKMEEAITIRDRKDLLNEWSPFTERMARRNQRDAEEITSDATERLLNSKRILLETVQASSVTLGSLATSSQGIQKNDNELQSQNYMVRTAHNLLKKYGRRASTDKILIWLAATFFGVVVLMVAWRRLL